ncbi:MAG: hypothetical protein QG561_540 [Patescibacteria group bacterium]|jgi:hypothetical protein|nr:hypothetical protein [Patescibacteria group bacterium]
MIDFDGGAMVVHFIRLTQSMTRKAKPKANKLIVSVVKPKENAFLYASAIEANASPEPRE